MKSRFAVSVLFALIAAGAIALNATSACKRLKSLERYRPGKLSHAVSAVAPIVSRAAVLISVVQANH